MGLGNIDLLICFCYILIYGKQDLRQPGLFFRCLHFIINFWALYPAIPCDQNFTRFGKLTVLRQRLLSSGKDIPDGVEFEYPARWDTE